MLAQDRAERFDLACAAAAALCADPACGGAASAGAQHHHLLMDGWSLPVLVRELLTLYAHRGDSAALLPRVTPYRDYLAWLAGRIAPPRFRPGRRPWRGWRRPPVWRAPRSGRASRWRPSRSRCADEALTAALSGRRAEQGLTLNTFCRRPGRSCWGADRPRGRGVRGDGGGPAAGDCRHRARWWGCSSIRCRCGCGCRREAAARAAREVQERQSRLMAHQHLGLAEIQESGRAGRAVRHAGGVRELSG